MTRETEEELLLHTVLIAASGIVGIADTEIVAPPGWNKTQEGANAVFTPTDLQSGETYRVVIFPPRPTGGKPLPDWLTEFARADGAGSAPKLEKNNPDSVVVSRTSTGADGAVQARLYTAGGKNGNVHVVRLTMSLATKVFPRYKEATNRIIRDAVTGGQTSAVASSSTSPKATPGETTIGGKLEPGLYVGKQYTVSGSERELRREMRLYIYPNGEYRVNDGNDKDFNYNTGTIRYDAKSGKLNIDSSFNLANSRTSPDQDFCIFGSRKDGTRVIYAEDYRGYGTVKTTLIYAGATKRPAPTAEKVAKASADAEAKRYKFVTAPGKGVQAGQIAAIIHEYDVELYSMGASGMGTNITDEAYLLLKDGTVHKGLPAPVDMLDVPTSRQKEPKKWGRWRQNGGKYQVSFGGGPYKKLDATRVIPAKPGERLAGRFGTGSSSASLMGSSYSLWGVTFTRDGRFKKDNRGGSGNSIFMQTGGQPAINSTYDDNGSVTSASGADFTVMSKNRKNPNGDREGTYSVEGYTMVLRYDNGSVARMPFFYTMANKSTIWFEGNQLAFDDGKD
ncbi:MAG: hypothetical protein H7145_14035 [Akkermansiaceae bacterium]|nr:hypothetical protein [Armatimonadota bacterium]